MAMDVADRALRDRRRGLAGWAVGIGAYVAMMVAFWPSIKGSTQITEAIQGYPDAMKQFFGGEASFDFSSPHGYLNAELFSLLVPLLLVIFAIGFGASTLAGEHESGLLDLILVNPVRRRRVVVEKAVALAGGVVLLAASSMVVMAVVGAAVGIDVGVVDLTAAFAGAALLCVLHGYLAMLAGVATRSRAAGIAAAAGVFTAGYLLQALAGLVSWLEPARVLSPFYLANGSMPIANGFAVAHDLVLAAVALAALAATVVAFERRDLAG